jgi:hypothetical protein
MGNFMELYSKAENRHDQVNNTQAVVGRKKNK